MDQPRTRRGRPYQEQVRGGSAPRTRTRGDEPRSRITRKANKNGVCSLFGVQINADLSRNDPRGAGSAGSTRRTEREQAKAHRREGRRHAVPTLPSWPALAATAAWHAEPIVRFVWPPAESLGMPTRILHR